MPYRLLAFGWDLHGGGGEVGSGENLIIALGAQLRLERQITLPVVSLQVIFSNEKGVRSRYSASRLRPSKSCEAIGFSPASRLNPLCFQRRPNQRTGGSLIGRITNREEPFNCRYPMQSTIGYFLSSILSVGIFNHFSRMPA